MHLGIDYGSKLAGTTSICFLQDGKLHFKQSSLKEDADQMISKFVQSHPVSKIFIDAPLSLPPAYLGIGDDFFFRACDKELSAMSPMFLGGLTARAMKLKSELESPTCTFIEIYPTIRGKVLSETYKKDKLNIETYLSILLNHVDVPFEDAPKNWHQIDSVLAWLIGKDFNDDKATSHGLEKEGLIWV